MIRKLFVLGALIVMPFKIYSQVVLEIKRLHVENVIYAQTDSNDFNSLFAENGPCITVFCKITNNTDLPITLILFNDGNDRNFIYQFNFRGRTYRGAPVKMFPGFHGIINGDTTYLDGLYKMNPGTSLEIFQNNCLLASTQLLGREKTDYTRELLEILPTLKIIYEDFDLYFESSEIETVTVDWYFRKRKPSLKVSE